MRIIDKLNIFLAQAGGGIGLPDDVRPSTVAGVSDAPVKTVITTVVGDVLLILIQFAGAIAIIMLIVAGLRYATSQGEEDRMATAKRNLVWTIVALLLIIFSYVITRTVFELATSVGTAS